MTASVEQVQAALLKLDVSNDNHWTAEGLPRLETVRMFAGDQSIGREHVTQASPQFTRANVAAAAAQAPAASTPAPAPTPAANPAVNATPAAVAQETNAAPPPVAETAGLPPPALDGLPNQTTVIANPLAGTAQPAAESVEDLQRELDEVNDELAQIARAEAEIAKAKRERQIRADDLLIRLDKATPRDSNQHGIMAYLESQAKIREARAAQIMRARNFEKESGFKITDLLPKRAPIDTAMARKTGYGLKRPGT